MKDKNKILFHHFGESQINLYKMISKFKLEDNVKLYGYLSHKDCLGKLNQMDALCFILDDRNQNSVNTIGGKVPENGEAADLIIHTKSGKVISPQNTHMISETLKEWIGGNTNFEFSDTEVYSREMQARQFLNVMNRACSRDQH